MDTFELAIQIEQTVAKIYDRLALQLEADGELRALFTLLREEELSHARRIAFVRDRMTKRGTFISLALDINVFVELDDDAQKVLELVCNTTLSSSQALLVAAELEEHFARVHAQALASETDPELTALFRELVDADRAHKVLLAKRARP